MLPFSQTHSTAIQFGKRQGMHIDFIFDPELCPDFSAVFRHYRPEYPHLNVKDAAPDLKVILDLLYAGAESGTQPDVKLLKGYLTIILFRIMEQLPLLSEQKFAKRDLTSKIVSYLMKNYQNSLSLGSVAAELGVSKYEISRVFSNKIKMGFNQYLNRMRLEQATYQLISTDLPVTEIAFSCGFESLRTFLPCLFGTVSDVAARISPKKSGADEKELIAKTVSIPLDFPCLHNYNKRKQEG